MSRSVATVLVVTLYLAAVLGWAYGVLNTHLYERRGLDAPVLLGLALVHVLVGAALGRWWALALPLAAIVLAVPAGQPGGYRDNLLGEWSVASQVALVAPVGVALLALGVGVRRIDARARRRG